MLQNALLMSFELPEHLPSLPVRHNLVAWSPNIQNAYQKVITTYDKVYQLLRQSDLDPLRLSLHVDILVREIHPILLALASIIDAQQIPRPWLNTVATTVAQLAEVLQEAHLNAHGRLVNQIMIPHSI